MARLMSLPKNKRILSILSLLLSCLMLFRSLPVFANPIKQDNVFYHCQTDKKLLALTFDDGPHPRYTPEILALLAQYQVPATFFMVGQNIVNYPEAARAVADAGHEIGNHTDTHPHMQKIDMNHLVKEIQTTADKIQALQGKRPTVFRPPEGICHSGISCVAGRMGYHVILWAVDTRDWAGTSPRQIIRSVENQVKSGDILLFHDYVSCKNTTVESLKVLIPQLLKEGYTFVTVSELLHEQERFLSTESAPH